ncbi:MAG: hypothetical protein P1U68_11385 [Verrucomicrobiales bacterium]|nr:hypothetical protein [Verrucomicrobiales bacterium]
MYFGRSRSLSSPEATLSLSFIRRAFYLLLHGRNPEKLEGTLNQLNLIEASGPAEGDLANFSNPDEVSVLVQSISIENQQLDVLINNAGILKAPNPLSANGKYFDNDTRQFSDPHPDLLDEEKTAKLVREIEEIVQL